MYELKTLKVGLQKREKLRKKNKQAKTEDKEKSSLPKCIFRIFV